MSGINKVIFGDQTLIDLSSDTVTPRNLLKGYKAYQADGTPIEGLFDPSGDTGNYIKKVIRKNGTYIASFELVDGYSEVKVVVESAKYRTTIDGEVQNRDLSFVSIGNNQYQLVTS